jgi:hypothetical protein
VGLAAEFAVSVENEHNQDPNLTLQASNDSVAEFFEMTYPTGSFSAKGGHLAIYAFEARYELAIGMVAKNTATTRQAAPDLFQTASARASTFRRTSATWTSMWSVLKTKALSPSGTIVWSCRSIDRYCQRPPKLLIQLALLST